MFFSFPLHVGRKAHKQNPQKSHDNPGNLSASLRNLGTPACFSKLLEFWTHHDWNHCEFNVDFYHKPWWVPNPPSAKSHVAERALWQPSQHAVARVSSLWEIPADCCDFPYASDALIRLQWSLARKASFSYQGASSKEVRCSPDLAQTS